MNKTSEKQANIRLVQNPLTYNDLMPDYRYELEGEVEQDAMNMYSDLVDFLRTNEGIIVTEPFNSREDYVKGFKKAVAIVRLWIDTIYLQQEQQEK